VTTKKPTTDTAPDPDALPTRPFADFIREQAKGATHDELSEALQDLVAKVRDTGKKGSLSLTIEVEPMKGDSKVLIVTDAIKLKLPEHDRQASLFYADKASNLVREDPDQLSFDSLREVNRETGEIKDLAR
jgi:hypothetical protein